MSRSVTVDFNKGITQYYGLPPQDFEPPPPPEDSVVNLPPADAVADSPKPSYTIVEVSEDFPANPDIILSPGQSVQPAIGTSGRIVELNAGNYGDQQLSPAASVHLFCRQLHGAVFQAPSTGQKRWIENGGNNVTLQNLWARKYGLHTFEGDAAFRFPSGSLGWKLIDVRISEAINGCIQWRGRNHELIRPVLHDYGRYGWSGGTTSLIKDATIYRGCLDDGTELVPRINDGDRGITKMAGGSSGMFIDGLTAWDIDGKGLWWDGARDGRGRRINIKNITHIGVDVEVCWGGAKVAPPNKTTTWPNPAFELEDIYVENQINVDNGSPQWPTPSGVGVSMTPGVWINNIEVNKAGGAGLSLISTSSHGVFEDGYPAQNISAQWAQDYLTNDNVRFEDFELRGTTKRYVVGVASHPGMWPDIPPVFDSKRTPSVGYAMQPTGSLGPFRWISDNTMTLSEWLALGHK